MADKEGG